MPRHEFMEGKSKIVFGHDMRSGYFLHVYDTRLAVRVQDGDELNDIRYALSEYGHGIYFRAYTGWLGLGTKVSYETMVELWQLYEVGMKGMALLAEKLATSTEDTKSLKSP